MASITIRHIDDEVKARLRVRAAANGRSMEEEARIILREAVGRKAEPENLPVSSANVSSHLAAWNSNYRHADRCMSLLISVETHSVRSRHR